MHVVIAPDCFTGTLTAKQAAEAMAQGWRSSAPHDLLTLVPLSDGGPGFLDVLATALPDAQTIAVTVADPLGREVPAALLMCEGESGLTAYIESAQATGLHLLAADERNPAVTSTWGAGQLLEAAVAEGADRVVVGLGGSGTNDGGAGLLGALGVGAPELLGRGGLALADLPDNGLAGLHDARARMSTLQLVVATDVESPLLGLQGASAVFAPQKGASPQLAQALEGALGRYVEVARRTLPEAVDLMTGKPRRLDKEPGAGAGGGLGYALYLLGGARVSGVAEVLSAVGFRDLLPAADLVVTGEGSFDWQSLQGKVVAGVATMALETATPSVVIAGQALVGRREAMTLGLSGTYAVAETPEQVEAAMADPVGTLARRTARVAATWSPAR
ncbi:glycerate kinase family protein [Pedococcus sp. 5OH_020]|uniref:glycerate kinase family protein n=1 Tax=Pedococcus sp. 5OH_020 TaxID=2989814 RepID=UPI0022E99A08|nr:glycerate kinase [Pedococcus sp. 5OH_020]